MTERTSEEKHDGACRRFQLTEGASLVGFIEYYPFEQVAIVTHTEVLQEMERKGRGSELACRALVHFQNEGRKVVPVCGFFAHFLRKHPEHAEMVTPESRRIFNI